MRTISAQEITDTVARLCIEANTRLPQDVQAMAADWPEEFFAERVVNFRAPQPEAFEIEAVAEILRKAKRPILVTGGGTLYSQGGTAALKAFAEKHGIPVGESHGGKGALAWDHPLLSGSIGVTGSIASNALAADADVMRHSGKVLHVADLARAYGFTDRDGSQPARYVIDNQEGGGDVAQG